MRLKKRMWLIGALPFFTGCFYELAPLSDIKGVKLATEIALPLFQDELGIKDIYDQFSKTGLIKQDGAEPLTFIYTTGDSIDKRQFINIPPVLVNFGIQADAAIATAFNFVGSFSQAFSGVTDIAVAGNEQFNKLEIGTGSLNLNITCDFKHNTKVVMSYPSITLNGQPLIDSFELNYSGTTPITVNRTINLAGYLIDFTNGGTASNKLPYNASLSVKKVAGNPDMVAGEKFGMSQYMVVPKYKFLEGYLGNFTLLRTSEIISIDLFSNQVGGRLFLNDPRLRIRISNGFGLPITCKISNFFARGYDDVPIPIAIDFLKDTFSLPFAVAPGQVGIGSYVIDRNNSNIDQVLNSAPKSISFVLDIQANYNNVPTNNFMFDTSSLKSFCDIEIPFDMRIDDYTVQHGDKFQFPEFANTQLKDLSIVTEATSTMPVGALIQVYFCKQKNVNGIDTFDIIDSLFTDGLKLDPADVDVNGNVIPIPRSAQSVCTMTNERYNNIQAAGCDYYYTKFRGNSARDANSNKPSVRIYNTQKIAVKVGMIGNAQYQSNGNQ
jgi:hypothetical protein